MHHAEAKAWLEREDATCRESRLDRLNWIAGLMPVAEYLAFPGGWMARYLFEEARYSFIYGQFLAAIILGIAYVERTLAALMYGMGQSELERANIFVLLRESVKIGWLSQAEFESLDHARALRNLVAHFRRPLDEGTIEQRSLELNELPYSVLEEDARHVMHAAVRLLARQAI